MSAPRSTPPDGQPSMGAGVASGGSIPGTSRPAYTLSHGQSVLPVLIAVPHAGRAYPADLLARMRDPGESQRRLEDRFVDLVAREAAAACSASLLVAHAPRAMLDLNRDPHDLDLSMFTASEAEKAVMRRKMPRGPGQGARSLRGLGLFPRRLPGVGELWRAPMVPQDANRRVAAIHAPYHDALGKALARMQDRWGEVLLLDLHSMPDLPAQASGVPAATHVVGDRFGASCRRDLVATAVDALDRSGLQVAYNRPYAGGYVLDRHGKPRNGIHAIQLEIARGEYLDSDAQPDAARVSIQAGIVAEVVRACAALLEGRGEWPLAAE
ncbi:N-formylglutamate amidohydrolase [Croceicoccus sediminis]|uniref:N-formylglutamate amidohydrolase n=1 Tax=Croceicoccus sediminis TaxID=2571150 RepID=UPI001F0E90EE|nr:N-formylglutamate amidohydrolase [Croceicoccus sediminis]